VFRLIRKRFQGKPLPLLRALFWASFKYDRSSLLQGVIAIFVVEIGLTAMFLSAIPAVASVLRTLQLK
jgi:hypothetical protein